MTFLLLSVVENIYKNREPVRQMKALYFISPTSKVSIFSPEREVLGWGVHSHVQDSVNLELKAFLIDFYFVCMVVFLLSYVCTRVQVPMEARREY